MTARKREAALPIAGNGWEILVLRLGIQKSGLKQRTYGTYRVYIDGQASGGLSGFICECIGPGDKVLKSGKRIAQGRYPLWTQFGKYKTIGYSTDTTDEKKTPRPGLCLKGTSPRNGILIHPGHPPKLYLSSIGCLNPTHTLNADRRMDYWDSRARTIALIDSLRAFAPAAFEKLAPTRIANAWAVIDGEPMDVLA